MLLQAGSHSALNLNLEIQSDSQLLTHTIICHLSHKDIMEVGSGQTHFLCLCFFIYEMGIIVAHT